MPHITDENMKYNYLIITILLFVSLHVLAKDKNFGNATVLEVTSIYDGDTFRANIEDFPAVIGDSMSIRINGVDTPELRGKCDKEKTTSKVSKTVHCRALESA
jgi:micrococcal nuclease